MSSHSRSNLLVGLAVLAIALFSIFVWIPLDTDSGLVEKIRGRVAIGDALAPTIACVFLLVGGLILILFERKAPNQPVIARSHVLFLGQMMIAIVLGILVMRFAGPLLAELVNQFRTEAIEYRLLRATPGWKHVGFVSGGMIIVAGMISVIERKVTRRAFVTALVAVLVMIFVFDVPFEDLLLPPNGDV